MAPEVFLDLGYDIRVDVWSLGVLLCEMTGGFSPFYNDDPLKMYLGITQGSIKWPKSITLETKMILASVF